jgi:hypothetical protein
MLRAHNLQTQKVYDKVRQSQLRQRSKARLQNAELSALSYCVSGTGSLGLLLFLVADGVLGALLNVERFIAASLEIPQSHW